MVDFLLQFSPAPRCQIKFPGEMARPDMLLMEAGPQTSFDEREFFFFRFHKQNELWPEQTWILKLS